MADHTSRLSQGALLTRLALLCAAGLSLAACQTSSNYDANGELQNSKPLAKPNFPVRGEAATTLAPAPAEPPPVQVVNASPAPPATPSTATAPVESNPLAPPPSAVVAVAPPTPPPPPSPPPKASAAVAMTAAAPIPPARPSATGSVTGGAEAQAATYVVKPSQGLDAIARETGTTRQTLIDLNDLRAPYSLKPGQKLKIAASTGGKTAVYVVAPGDTLFSIAKRFEATPAEMAELNNFKAGDPIHPGQHLTLPRKYQSGPAMVAAVPPGPAMRPTTALTPMPSAPPKTVAVTQPTPAPVAKPTASPSAELVRTAPTTVPPAASLAQPPTQIARATPSAALSITTPSVPAGPPIERATASSSQVKAAGSGKFIWPVKGRILSAYGPKSDGQRNDGINIAAPMNAPVRAAASGEVIYAGDVLREYGNLVLIQHADGFVTAYGHLAKVSVKMKDRVTQNQEIGQVGDSGGVSQPQLHFETRYARTAADSPAPPVDPLLVLPGNP